MSMMPPASVDLVSRPVYVPGTMVPTTGNHQYTSIWDPATGRRTVAEFLKDPATGLLAGYLYQDTGSNPGLPGVTPESQFQVNMEAGVSNPQYASYDAVIIVAAQAIAYFNATSADSYPALGLGTNSNSADVGLNMYLSQALGLQFGDDEAVLQQHDNLPYSDSPLPVSAFAPNYDNLFEYASYVANGVDPLHIQSDLFDASKIGTTAGIDGKAPGIQDDGSIDFVRVFNPFTVDPSDPNFDRDQFLA